LPFSEHAEKSFSKVSTLSQTVRMEPKGLLVNFRARANSAESQKQTFLPIRLRVPLLLESPQKLPDTPTQTVSHANSERASIRAALQLLLVGSVPGLSSVNSPQQKGYCWAICFSNKSVQQSFTV
ncbi:hypothetical protein H1C71_027560, partial [Ictidomys tridecemlineatus]